MGSKTRYVVPGSETAVKLLTESGARECECGGCLHTHCYSQSAVLCWCTTCGLLAICALGTLIGLAVNWVHPYLRALAMTSTTCQALGTNFTQVREACSCPQTGCKSSFSCVAVKVKVNLTQTGSDIMLYQNEEVWGKLPICSYKIAKCMNLEAENDKQVANFKKAYGEPGAQFPCLSDGSVALLRRMRTNNWLMHVLLWPSLAVFISCVGLYVVYLHCCPKCLDLD